MLPDNNTGMDEMGNSNFHMALAANFRTVGGTLMSICMLAVIVVAVLRLSLINRRLGVTIQAIEVSLPVSLVRPSCWSAAGCGHNSVAEASGHHSSLGIPALSLRLARRCLRTSCCCFWG